jgi:hypothetical protein
VLEAFGLDDLVHEPDPKRALGVEAGGGREERLGVPRADLAKDVGRDRRRDQPRRASSEPEPRARDGHGDVGDRHQAGSTAEGVPVHPGDHRERAVVDRLEQAAHDGGVGDVLLGREVAAAAHPVDVRARTEGVARARQDEDARAVERQGSHEFAELDHHPGLERVSGLGPVESQRGDRAVACQADGAHIRNTPKVVSGTGAYAAAAMPRASTRRVSAGSMMPSSHRRAVEKYGLPSRS